jgi:hypothetical protein
MAGLPIATRAIVENYERFIEPISIQTIQPLLEEPGAMGEYAGVSATNAG